MSSIESEFEKHLKTLDKDTLIEWVMHKELELSETSRECREKDQKIKELERELALYKKALELSCEDCKRAYDLEYLSFDVSIGSIQDFKNVYLEKAREEIENEQKASKKKLKKNCEKHLTN